MRSVLGGRAAAEGRCAFGMILPLISSAFMRHGRRKNRRKRRCSIVVVMVGDAFVAECSPIRIVRCLPISADSKDIPKNPFILLLILPIPYNPEKNEKTVKRMPTCHTKGTANTE
jgi:hypothetical protein